MCVGTIFFNKEINFQFIELQVIYLNSFVDVNNTTISKYFYRVAGSEQGWMDQERLFFSFHLALRNMAVYILNADDDDVLHIVNIRNGLDVRIKYIVLKITILSSVSRKYRMYKKYLNYKM